MFFVRYFFSVFGAETFKKTRILIHVMNFGLLLRFAQEITDIVFFKITLPSYFGPHFGCFKSLIIHPLQLYMYFFDSMIT